MSRIASCLCTSATRSSSSSSRMYRSWSCALFSRPGSVEIIISICCTFMIRSCASSTWPALNSSSGMGSTGCFGRGLERMACLVLGRAYAWWFILTLFQVLLWFDLLDLVAGAKGFAIVMPVQEVDACDELACQLEESPSGPAFVARQLMALTWSTESCSCVNLSPILLCEKQAQVGCR